MAIYHCACQVISRGAGRSAVGAAAYRSGDKLTNEYDGITHDYTNKGGVIYSEISLCKNAPQRYLDRATLWNEVERVEKSAKAQLCREYEMALPRELNHDEQIKFARDFVKQNFADRGMCADWSIHDKGDGNPHVHILVTMRPIERDGSWGLKQKKEYILDKNGNKQYDPKKQTYKCKTVKTTDWDSKDFLERTREAWAVAMNRELEKKDLPQRVDHRTLEAQGIDRQATIHEGVAARAMEQGRPGREPMTADRCEVNRAIKQANAQMAAIDQEISEVERSIGGAKEDIAWNAIHSELADIRGNANGWSEAAQLASLERLDKLAARTTETIEAQKGSIYHARAVIDDMAYLDYHRAKATEEQAIVRANIGHSLDYIRNTYPVYDTYEYGKVDPQRIDRFMRSERDEDGYMRVVRRGDAERAIIMDVQRADRQLCELYDATQLRRLINQQAEARKLGKPARNRDEELVRQIQESCANLRFLERTGIYNTEQLVKGITELQAKLDSCKEAIQQAETMADQLGQVDPAPARTYQKKISELRAQLPAIQRELMEYSRCMRVFDRMDRDAGRPAPALVRPHHQPEKAAKLPKAEQQAAPECEPAQDNKAPAAAKVAEQPKPIQKTEPTKVGTREEAPRVDLRPTAAPKADTFNADKVGMQLAGYRTEYVKASLQAQKPCYYKPDTTYRTRAQAITDAVRNIRDYKASVAQLDVEIGKLGLFQGKQKKALEAKRTDFHRRWRDEDTKLKPEALALGFDISDLAGAEAAASRLMERAAQEDAKAKAALANVGAAERAENAKEAFLALAKTVPEDRKQAVVDAMKYYRDIDADKGVSVAESYRAEKAAKEQLDAALKPQSGIHTVARQKQQSHGDR